MIYLLNHIIQQAAEQHTDRLAFRCAGQQLTFGELMRRTHQLANLLTERGVRKGDRVGIYLHRSLETAIAVYGIMKSGAVFVPLDPQAPVNRTRLLLEDCSIHHVVSHPAHRVALLEILSEPTPLKSVIGLADDLPVQSCSWETVQELNGDASPDVRIVPQDLAYIMYTSGTTGAPKGIMHTHFSALNYAELSAQLYGLHPDDRIANHSPLHFDISTFGYFSAPLAGAATVIIPEAHTRFPASLSKLMEDEQLTVWYSVPLALIQLLQNGLLEQRNLQTLRWVMFGGEPFPPKHLRALMQQWPHARFSNVYGPAEVNQCTYFHLDSLPLDGTPIPLGQVWNNTEVMIIDADDEEVTPGEPGELVVHTVTMMRGYWRQPELSKKSMLERSGASGEVKTYYRTGDMVRQGSDGLLVFLGRMDRQIKTRGYRVELDEVEAILVQHDFVEEAAVFSVHGSDDVVRIEAVVVLNTRETEWMESLQTHLSAHLPGYAIPNRITTAAQLVRTAAGKIDYKALQRQASKTQNA